MSTDSIDRDIAKLAKRFPVTVEVRNTEDKPRLLGGLECDAGTVVAFIFGAVSASFFSEMGKGLWKACEGLCKKVLDRRKREPAELTGAVVSWECEGTQFSVLLDSRHINPLQFAAEFGAQPFDYFWKSIGAYQVELICTSGEGEVIARLGDKGWEVVPADQKWALGPEFIR